VTDQSPTDTDGPRLSRREFLRSSGAYAGAAALSGLSTAGCRTGPRRPNVLWIMTDEQRPDSLGCYGSSWAKTPAIDGLARRGVLMQNAVCQAPICVPSRASQFAALYPQECGALATADAQHGFPTGTITFTDILREAGYELVNLGKTHSPAHPTWHVSEGPVLLPRYAGYYDLNEAYSEEAHHVIKRPGGTPIILAGTYPVAEGHPSQILTDRAIDALRARSDPQKPFLLRVSHNWPHTPVLAPPPFDQLYDPDEIPIVFFDEEAYRGRSRYDRSIADTMRMRELSRTQIRQMWKDYYGLCACVDHEVGRLLRALDDLGLAEDTVVLFQSDHGKSLGEWGSGEKGTFDSEVWRVPFIWSAPALGLEQGAVREDPCESIDTARTLLTLLGLEERIPADFRGRDLFGASPAPDAVFGQWGFRQMRCGVRTTRHRMDVTWSEQGRRVEPSELDGNLFDLQRDPQERTNLYEDANHASVRRQLLEQLEAWDSTLRPFDVELRA